VYQGMAFQLVLPVEGGPTDVTRPGLVARVDELVGA